MNHYTVYIIGNWTGDVLYIGMTNDLARRLKEHKQKLVKGFTSKYSVDKLLYYEVFDTPSDAINREKQLKKWRRAKKNALIETLNANWDDLSEQIG